jgi:hypothetical protein
MFCLFEDGHLGTLREHIIKDIGGLKSKRKEKKKLLSF